jgi:hypothetical protein
MNIGINEEAIVNLLPKASEMNPDAGYPSIAANVPAEYTSPICQGSKSIESLRNIPNCQPQMLIENCAIPVTVANRQSLSLRPKKTLPEDPAVPDEDSDGPDMMGGWSSDIAVRL